MAVMKTGLSVGRQRLLELMQRQNFCRIEHLKVNQGEPVFDPPPTVIQHVRIGGDNGPKVQIYLKDYALKQAQVELFEHLDAFGTGVVDELEVRYGLPQHLKIRRSAA
jgi:hypothetical protein